MTDDIRETVRAHYAQAITEVRQGSGCCCGSAPTEETFASGKYDEDFRDGVDPDLVQASFGCGNPAFGRRPEPRGTRPGSRLRRWPRRPALRQRVGPTGRAYGLDMTDEMLAPARHNAEQAGATNVEFLKGHIEQIPLADDTVDVVISNCVINLSPDKPAVFAEIRRVLTPGGRLGVTDIVCDDDTTPQQRAAHGDWASCAAGALSRGEYVRGLRTAGFTEVEVRYTDDFEHGMHAAIIRAVAPSA